MMSEQEQTEWDEGTGNYLTMARIMKEEWAVWLSKNSLEYARMTGFEQIHSKNAFRDGFMAGFEGRYFRTGD